MHADMKHCRGLEGGKRPFIGIGDKGKPGMLDDIAGIAAIFTEDVRGDNLTGQQHSIGDKPVNQPARSNEFEFSGPMVGDRAVNLVVTMIDPTTGIAERSRVGADICHFPIPAPEASRSPNRTIGRRR